MPLSAPTVLSNVMGIFPDASSSFATSRGVFCGETPNWTRAGAPLASIIARDERTEALSYTVGAACPTRPDNGGGRSSGGVFIILGETQGGTAKCVANIAKCKTTTNVLFRPFTMETLRALQRSEAHARRAHTLERLYSVKFRGVDITTPERVFELFSQGESHYLLTQECPFERDERVKTPVHMAAHLQAACFYAASDNVVIPRFFRSLRAVHVLVSWLVESYTRAWQEAVHRSLAEHLPKDTVSTIVAMSLKDSAWSERASAEVSRFGETGGLRLLKNIVGAVAELAARVADLGERTRWGSLRFTKLARLGFLDQRLGHRVMQLKLIGGSTITLLIPNTVELPSTVDAERIFRSHYPDIIDETLGKGIVLKRVTESPSARISFVLSRAEDESCAVVCQWGTLRETFKTHEVRGGVAQWVYAVLADAFVRPSYFSMKQGRGDVRLYVYRRTSKSTVVSKLLRHIYTSRRQQEATIYVTAH